MADVNEVISAAQKFASKDDRALEVLLGMVHQEVKEKPQLENKAYVEPKYDSSKMGALEDVRALGIRILHRYNQQLYGLVCGAQSSDKKERKEILDSLSLGSSAVIGAVVVALLSIGVSAPISAVLAPLIVKRFIWPAKDELCATWKEKIDAS